MTTHTVPHTHTPSPTTSPATHWLDHPTIGGLSRAQWLVGGLIGLSAFLHFYRLSALGDGNLYYTAAVQSMLQSWHNFFFVAAEPGASVTVDKPPLGLWIQTGFAYFLGVNGVAVMLPNILAGLANIPLLYSMVRRVFGSVGGVTAALVLVLTPVSLAAERNNTMDGLLTFLILLTAWVFWQAAESGRTRYLWWAGLLVGAGFNIKMLQMVVPLPAFYALYLWAAPHSWGRKVGHLAAVTALWVVLALAWPVAVDLTPADQRPYVGSSTNNTVLELIAGHNGLNRLFGGGGGDGGQRPQGPPPTNGQPPVGNALAGAPPANGRPAGPDGGPGQGGPGGGPTAEVGEPGLGRFFSAPLSKELSWLLPLAMVGLALVVWQSGRFWRQPATAATQFALVWGGWLAIGWLFFSLASFYHAYYLVMLGPPLAALAGAAVAIVWQGRYTVLLGGAAVLTLLFQALNAWQLGVGPWWMVGVVPLAAVGMALFGGQKRPRTGTALVVGALLITPLLWSWWTITRVDNVNLPAAYAGQAGQSGPPPRTAAPELIAFLQANTADSTYLLAVPSAQVGAPYVLATGRPVLYMGGFGGGDPVVGADEVAALVAAGDLRYVMVQEQGNGRPTGPGGPGGNNANQQGVATWVQGHCTAVGGASAVGEGPGERPSQLYDCGG